MTCAVGFQWSCSFKWGSCIPSETIRNRRGFRPRALESSAVLVLFDTRCSCARILREPVAVGWERWGPMEEEKDAFYVVRKGDTVGVYKSLKDCQGQLWDPTFSVYKGHYLSKQAEEYLALCGLKNAAYSICSMDLKEDVFGPLVPCSHQEPDGVFSSFAKRSSKTVEQKRPVEIRDADSINEACGSTGLPNERSKHQKIINATARPIASYSEPLRLQVAQLEENINDCGSTTHISKSRNDICVLEFDGASKGNPGKAGAGAVLRMDGGTMICRLREGVGVATNNFAEYRAVILGMKYALRKGVTRIKVQGDSMLVCMQIQNKWQTKNKNILDLSNEAKKLKDKFLSFQINHIPRELNSEADRQANLAIVLADGEVEEEYENKLLT
ncbi:uncharacterized protein LOC116262010 isoform X2 [Nymphaea colorata]|uniref:uncharacterized protein LOC116262010 isoform X2 n=1 Tax=Nymphaea colorata TaxID=210225 RepID=UPI00129E3CE9|nr:uncharacterized protein LOC116262010 isoform X2 [Nymphaea colorata]